MRFEDILDKKLLHPPRRPIDDYGPRGLLESTLEEAMKQGIKVEPCELMEYWGGLCRIGAVVILGEGVPISRGEPYAPSFCLTARGRRLLQLQEKSPHNPHKYFSALQNRVPNADETARSYLEEAVDAWRSGLNRASAVMLGCACERLIVLLAQTIASAAWLPEATSVSDELEKGRSVSSLFEKIRDVLGRLRREKKLSSSVRDALDRRLSAIFDYARRLRNKSGHPTGESVADEEAEAGLVLFPEFHQFINSLRHEIAQLQSASAVAI